MRTTTLSCLLAASLAAAPLHAQEPVAPAGTVLSPMAAHGSVDLGYRFLDVTGNVDTFRQLFDLSEGARVFGADLRVTGGSAPSRLFDTLTLNAAGLGGDPFPSMQLRARRSRRYDLRASWRRARFFSVSPLTPASIDGFDTQAVTDRHSWTTARQIGNVGITVNPSTRLQLNVSYDRLRRNGAIGSTRAIDFVGSPTAWGGFARANPFPVTGPVDDTSNRLVGGLTYARDRWTVHYQTGYQAYDETLTLGPQASPERSINVSDANTARELLTNGRWVQTRSLGTIPSELSFVVQAATTVEWRGEYLYFRSRGPFDLDASFAGSARTAIATVTSPYQVVLAASGEGRFASHVVGQGMTYRPSRLWGVDLDLRYSKTNSESNGDLTSRLTGYTAAISDPSTAAEHDALSWQEALTTVRAAAVLQPHPTLTIRPGVRLARREIVMKEGLEVDPATTRDDNTVTPELSAVYKPARWLTARGAFRMSSNDSAYTRMSPSDRSVAHLGVVVEPAEGLTLTAAVDRTHATLATASFESNIQGGSVGATYAFNNRVTAFGSFDYRSLLALGDTTFLRGTAPIADILMRDSEVDRVWQGGATVRITTRLEATATGSYDRVSGNDIITGEPPLYGPLTFPLGTVSASYDVARVGKLSLDVQRLHYFQPLLPLNDVSASIVTIRYTRTF